MSPSGGGRVRRWALGAVVALVVGLVPAVAPAQDGGLVPEGVARLLEYGIQGEGHARVHDLDRRLGRITPTADQLAAADRLGATRAVWNDFGTPHVLIDHGGTLTGPAEGSAVDVARAFVADHAALFRLDQAAVERLEVLRDSPLYDSPDLARARDGQPVQNPDVAHVVLFRQTFDVDGATVPAGRDGLLTIGVTADGAIAWVSSTVTGDDQVSGTAALDPIAAIEAVAADVGFDLGALAPSDVVEDGWTTFEATTTADLQRVRTVALPTPTDGVRLAYEVTLLASEPDADDHGNPVAFIAFVDAADGTVWYRTNRVEHLADTADGVLLAQGTPSGGQFSGSTAPGACGPDHVFAVAEGNQTITVGAAALTPTGVSDDDITIELAHDGEVVATQDLLTSPEALVYSPAGGLPAGDYVVRICPFNGAAAPEIPYQGIFTASAGVGAGVPLPRWLVFPTNPNLTTAEDPSADTRVLWCWGDLADDCERDITNTASRSPWDVLPGGVPSLTTAGNNASTAISEASFLTPDTIVDRPAPDPTRTYDAPWTNAWFESQCNPANFATDNDDDASTYNLFAMHNRMHDWSYSLGFTEVNANLQQSNFGAGGVEGDPELGSSQAGRLTFNGRDNANQITLQDGIPGITNQYLWQPLAGSFYATCTDGAYDMAIVAHEYAHAISGRMTAGPDTTLGATQGQSESWSDLAFAEYFRGFGLTAGEDVNPYALAPYVTGDPQAGIRNYGMNASPLNYSDIQYDGNGTTSPHADGEIWSAVNYDLAEAMNAVYDATHPSDDLALQESCARGERPADACPGNRRWAQLMFDGLLLQPPDPSMVDSRDAMLAADVMRFDGANQEVLWRAFARRGLGEDAASDGPEDPDPVPSFASPESDDEATVTFAAGGDGGADTQMEVFVGHYEARAVPIANTFDETAVDDPDQPVEGEDPADGEEEPVEIGDTASLVPGSYDLIATAPGFGGYRFSLDLRAGEERTVEVPLRRNVASASSGATIAGVGVNLDLLIDDTEETNWASRADDAPAEPVEGEQVAGRTVTVDLAGDAAVPVAEVQVSAMLRPEVIADEDPIIGTPEDDDPEEGPEEPDPGGQSRFSALRSFDILACNADAGDDCASDGGFTTIYESPDDAFDGRRPRPKVPDLTLRAFDVDDVEATHLRLVVRDNQCTGGPDFQGEANPVQDPIFQLPDCDSEAASPDRAVLSPPNREVRAAELQVFSQPAPTLAGGAIDRVAGESRVETAVALAQLAFPDGADTVVLARADDFPDALAAATLTAEVDGPLLLTGTEALHPAVAAELERLGATTVYLAGGTAALAPAVEDAVAGIVDTVERLAGIDRFDTARLIGEEVVQLGGAVGAVVVARADAFPDALAAANLATSGRAPILLTSTEAMPHATTEALDVLLGDAGDVVVAGGTAAVSAAVETALGDRGHAVERIGGATRYDTAALIVEAALAAGVDLDPLLLASGEDFPDALTAGPAAHVLGGALGLVHADDLASSPETAALLTDHAGEVGEVLVAGGPAAVADAVLEAVAAVLDG
ncbi:M36 family metallopeptidase [Euzebya sp.]|uniref:M36 family metallopeptidase n=1 Tax=Euzebya sp. TaxID=1971409 RepID=UPI0035169F25